MVLWPILDRWKTKHLNSRGFLYWDKSYLPLSSLNSDLIPTCRMSVSKRTPVFLHTNLLKKIVGNLSKSCLIIFRGLQQVISVFHTHLIDSWTTKITSSLSTTCFWCYINSSQKLFDNAKSTYQKIKYVKYNFK